MRRNLAILSMLHKILEREKFGQSFEIEIIAFGGQRGSHSHRLPIQELLIHMQVVHAWSKTITEDVLGSQIDVCDVSC